MNIIQTNENDQITIKLEGWLDTLSAPELGAVVEAIEKASSIVLDFDGVEYMASSGLRQVVACHLKAKELNATYSVINVSTDIMNIFQLTGIDKKIAISKKTEA